ncbi:MAG: hypothetical protein N3A55_01900 [Methylohalobius sp.]|nr:hypothetical protein [Methylohalobius sp.]
MRRVWQIGWLAVSLAGCAAQPKSQPPQASNDFPTQARVEYVFECMQKHGGQNYDNLYHCSCALDELAKQMGYQEYSEAIVFTKLRSMPGEDGGVFRDPPKANKLRAKLKAAEEAAEKACFVK